MWSVKMRGGSNNGQKGKEKQALAGFVCLEWSLTCTKFGYFFNGHQYMSFDGTRSTTHPCLDEYLQQWVDEQNVQSKQIQAALGNH
eukprot:m.203889 g.203889  ORF g.203889 m.203889 type:complete len:86 (+) comp26012_c0_seq5:135-392(+)